MFSYKVCAAYGPGTFDHELQLMNYDNIRPVLFGNVFLVTHLHTILKAACFGPYFQYLSLRMLSSITKINVNHPIFGLSRKCSNCSGYVEVK